MRGANGTGQQAGLPPIAGIIIGCVLLIFFAGGLAIDIQASESFFLGGHAMSLALNWNIFMQPVLLMQGKLEPQETVAVVWGFSIEALFLVCIIGLEQALSGLSDVHQHFPKIFGTLTTILVILNAVSDYMYYGGDVLRGLAFALIMFVVVGFFGIVGLILIERSYKAIFHP